jgi:hypothetical protein
MIKGVFVGLLVILVGPFIPIVHFVAVPFGPFIAGYIGISSVGSYPGSAGRKALVFGTIFGGMMGAVFVLAAAIVTAVSDFYPVLLWGGVAVFTFYYSSMSALGAWYAGLRSGS